MGQVIFQVGRGYELLGGGDLNLNTKGLGFYKVMEIVISPKCMTCNFIQIMQLKSPKPSC